MASCWEPSSSVLLECRLNLITEGSDERRAPWRSQLRWAAIPPWLFGILAYWLIVVADPYHLRNSSTLYSLADHRYPDLEWPRLIGVATAHTHDLVLLGGSSGMPITSNMMREAFPGAQSPVNLELAQRPLDMPLVLPRIAQVAGLRHVILFMDFSLLDSAPRREPYGKNAGKNRGDQLESQCGIWDLDRAGLATRDRDWNLSFPWLVNDRWAPIHGWRRASHAVR